MRASNVDGALNHSPMSLSYQFQVLCVGISNFLDGREGWKGGMEGRDGREGWKGGMSRGEGSGGEGRKGKGREGKGGEGSYVLDEIKSTATPP